MSIKANWLRFAKTFVLMCFVFSFNATAQTSSDRALEATELAALVKELKEVVTKTSPDKNETRMVIEKWDKRTDLAGKTKSEVIEMLFTDVKSVIKDSGTQYEIYTIFSPYKQIPVQTVQTRESLSKMSKEELVGKLVEATFSSHHFSGVEAKPESPSVLDEIVQKMSPEERKAYEKAKEEDERKIQEEVKKLRNDDFDEILEQNKKLTPAQKSFVRANYDRLDEIINQLVVESNKKYFLFDQWLRESLQTSYTNSFTKEELTDLILKFQTDEGKKFLETILVSDFIWGYLEKTVERIPADERAEYTNSPEYKKILAERNEYLAFASSETGKKFVRAYTEEVSANLESKEKEVRLKNPEAGGYYITQPENINIIFNKFVEENYKK